MNPRSKTVLAAAIVGVLGLGAVAGIAHADKPQGREGHGMSRHHGMAMHQRIREFAERYDLNKDGKITQDEINSNRAQWLAEFDTNKDGALTIEEFQALWLKARHLEMVREYQRFDRDGDGKVTLEEYQWPLSEIVQNMDRNGDGALSREDRPRHQGRPAQEPAQGQDKQQSE